MQPTLAKKSFYFIRHGETDWNKNNIIMGQQDIPLNEVGINQAHKAKELLINCEIENIYTSPLKRASDTASIINEGRKLKLRYLDALKERSWGQEEGKPHIKYLTGLSDGQLPEGAERYIDFELRVMGAIEQILNLTKVTPLIVAHGGIFVVIATIIGFPNLRAQNCVPYFFEPPTTNNHQWSISNL